MTRIVERTSEYSSGAVRTTKVLNQGNPERGLAGADHFTELTASMRVRQTWYLGS